MQVVIRDEFVGASFFRAFEEISGGKVGWANMLSWDIEHLFWSVLHLDNSQIQKRVPL